MERVVLASQSPRRRELLGRIFTEFDVIPSGVEETVSGECTPAEYVSALALSKAKDVAAKVGPTALVIGSDTVVVCDGEILEKPKDEADAFEMLQVLR